MDPLTRESRYKGRYILSAYAPDGNVVEHGAEFTCCLSCGALIATGHEDLHERLHPRLGCMSVHTTAVYHPGGHAWEEQFW